MRKVWMSGSVVMLMAATACSFQVGGGGSAGSPPPPRRNARAAPPPPPPPPPPAAAPAPAPAPAAAPGKPLRLGRAPQAAPPPAAPAAPAPARESPMQVSPFQTAGAIAGFSGPLNLARLQELRARNPKACGLLEVSPGNWVRVDCQLYQPAQKAVDHLSIRKARMVETRMTSWKPARLWSTALKASLSKFSTNLKKRGKGPNPGLDKAGPGSGGDGDAKADAFPDTVDHRTANLEGPIKDQGPVGSCTAFSLSSVIDNAAIRAGKMAAGTAAQASSPSHIWSSYGYPQMGVAADANVGRSIATLGTWSQDNRDTCKLSSPMAGEDCGGTFSPAIEPGSWRTDPRLVAKYDAAQANGSYKIAVLERLKTQPPKLDELVQILATGSDLWVAMKIDGYAWSNGKIKPNKGVIPDWDGYAGGHAVTMSGYRETPSGRQFLIHNSWGTGWGEQGYAWVSEAMVVKYMHYAYKVKLSDGVRHEDLTDDDCAPDELVDPARMICAVICPDDSRPNNGCGKK